MTPSRHCIQVFNGVYACTMSVGKATTCCIFIKTGLLAAVAERS